MDLDRLEQRNSDMAAYIRAGDNGEVSEAFKYLFILLLILGVGKGVAKLIPWGPDILFTVIVYYQIQIPLNMLDKYGLDGRAFGLHAHGVLSTAARQVRRWILLLRRKSERDSFIRKASSPKLFTMWYLAHHGRGGAIDAIGLKRELKTLAWTLLLTFVPFVLFYHLGAGMTYERDTVFPFVRDVHYAAVNVPDFCPPHKGLLMTVLLNLLVVAVPEELFYRGYFETTLLKRYPLRAWAIVPLGRAVWISATFFALGHFLGDWNPARLGPFFPAFVFSMLTRRTGSIAGAVLYHALSNILSATLFAMYSDQCGGWIY